MRQTLTILLTALFVLASSDSDARSRHRHHGYHRHHSSACRGDGCYNRDPLGYRTHGRAGYDRR